MSLTPAIWFPAIRAGTGADVFTERLCAELNKRGIQAEIAWLPQRAEYAPWTVAKPKPPAWANIVHANSWLHPRFLPNGLPVVTTLHSCVHDPALAPYKQPTQRLYHEAWIRPVEVTHLARATRIVAVSHYTAQAAKVAFGLEHIKVIHNGVDTMGFKPLARLKPNFPFRLLYVGNWSARKGVDLLAPILHKLGNDFELVYTADRNNAHENYALPTNCRCLDRLSGDALISAYQQADALLFPSRLEGLPLTVLEAMACGLPLIATKGSSLPEVIESKINGLLCAQDDPVDFANAASVIIENLEFWQIMRQNARMRAENLFSIDAMINQYTEIYREVTIDPEHRRLNFC